MPDNNRSPQFTSTQLSGAEWILTQALQVQEEQTVLIIHDEATLKVAECIAEAGRGRGVDSLLLHVPAKEQVGYQSSDTLVLPENIRSAVDERLFVVVLQELRPEVNQFRLLLLDYCKGNNHRKTASLPGFELASLAFCAGSLEQITHRCSLVADLLVRASSARVLSTAVDGSVLRLDIPIGDYMPIMSTGLIAPGSWGNVPSGETFIVPNEKSAVGDITFRGSILGYAIPAGEELILEFSKGKAKVRSATSQSLIRAAQRILYDADGREVQPNSSVLAELGIGTNEGITALTGQPLFDEKVLGTVHLGLGRNTQFGGRITSPIHNDYVATGASLIVDGIPIVKDGRFVLQESDVYPRWQDLPALSVDVRSIAKGASTYIEIGGGAYVQWADPRARELRTTLVGDSDTARLAAEILHVLDRSRRPLSVDQLGASLKKSFPQAALRPLLAFLNCFELIALK